MITENLGTILTVLVLTVIVAAVIIKIRRDRKNNACGGCSNNCGCRK